ncbi:MAG: hypothetical protein AMJ65_06650 [Phycisphaerae bacterium SG8_4]|nr:MAG: hypothetical protein AMJ65_06650 [Phycisphaerae bacterium SG8_4]
MERQVELYIQGLSDLELLEYTRTPTHLPEALEFANVELAERHLPAELLTALEKQLKQRQEAREEEARAIAAEPLNWEWRIAAFLCGVQIPRTRRRPKIQRNVGLGPDRSFARPDSSPASHPSLELGKSAALNTV